MNIPHIKTPPVGAQILFAIGVNLAQTLVCIRQDGAGNIAFGFMIVSCAAYIILINVVNKGQVPKAVRTAYVWSMFVQILLNIIGVVPPDGGFLGGFNQFLYCVTLVIAAIVGSIASRICESLSVRRGQDIKAVHNKAVLMKHLVIAGVLNGVQGAVCLITGRMSAPLILMLTADIPYIVWSAYDTDGHTMWSAYLGFVIACGVQCAVFLFASLLPNWSFGIYCLSLVVIAFLYGTVNLIRGKAQGRAMCRSAAARSGQNKEHAPNE